jgi:Na+-transporting NADH:ubiquinone oxidoreductase subunit C
VQQPTALGYETAIEQQLTKLEFAQGNRVWEVYIRKTPPMDIGFVFSGMGFWDEIRGVLVLSPNLNEISSIEFLDQKETPGLGARIEEQWFKGQFNGYTIDWDQPIQDRIVFGQQNNGKAIDAITGATQTTMALERILNTELAEFRTIYQQKNLGQSTRN